MSILIKGIDLPKSGDRHRITIYDNGNAYITTTSNPIYETEIKDVEVIQIPAPHGRLKEELEKKLYEYIDPFEVPGALEACYDTMEAFYDAMDRFTKGE